DNTSNITKIHIESIKQAPVNRDTNLHLTASLIKNPDLSITANYSFQFVYYALQAHKATENTGD
ncbi:MAG: hypothetical protein WCF03_04970, partial [Nitrososphaeraceae archaeon]